MPGTLGTLALWDRLRAFKPVRGVFGNIDGADIRAELPQNLHWTCEGIRVFMTHIGGYPGAYDRRAKEALLREPADLFICGHSHILKVMRDPKLGVLHMNPGASGQSGWHQMRTVLRFSIDQGKIGNVEAIELGVRGTKKST